MTDRIVIITGSRDYHGPLVAQCLEQELRKMPLGDRLAVLHGAARGADTAAVEWVSGARDRRISEYAFVANWVKHGNAAGMMRNRQMLNDALAWTNRGQATLKAYAFPSPDSKGTRGMIRLLEKAGVQTETHEVYTEESFAALEHAYRTMTTRPPEIDGTRSHGAWLEISRLAERIANVLIATGQREHRNTAPAMSRAVQAAFRAHDGKRAWELSVGWGLATPEKDGARG